MYRPAHKTGPCGDSVADVEIDTEVDPPDTFGPALRRTRLAKGVSLRALGARVHYSKGHLSKIENGLVQARLDLAEACDAALGANGRLAAVFLAGTPRQLSASDLKCADVPFDILPQPSYFTGRADETSLLLSALLSPVTLSRAPVVLIHGMPGIGKTALALHVAHAVRARYPGGCLFVEFGTQTGPDPVLGVLARLLRRLGVAAEAVPADPGEARALYLSILSRRPVLILADDVSSSDQVAALVSASPACAVIATSRHRLDALDDCLAIRLGPLGGDDAAALFRLIADRPDALPDADLARIATACGGLPLAIRVAAARFRESGRSSAELADLLERLPATWEELDDGERSVKRTLRTELDALPQSGQRTLAMLALCPAGAADSHAVGWLADRASQAVATEFSELRRHNLLSVDPHGRASMHALIRALGASIADQIDEHSREQAIRRLIAGCTRSASAADGLMTALRFRPPDANDAITAAPVRFDTAAAAMAWCRAAAECIPQLCSLAYDKGLDAECWRLAYAMRSYFFTVKAFQPWEASHRTALLAAERRGDLWAQAVTRNNLGLAFAEQLRISAADAQYARALEILGAIGDRRGVATTLGHQAWARHADGRDEAAVSLAAAAITMHRHHDDRRSLAIMDRTAALANSNLGEHRLALAHLAECEEILSELDLPLDVAMTCNCLGEVHCRMGRFDQAEAFHARAAELSAACGGISEEARAVKGMAVAARATGSGARADDLYRRAATLRARFDQTSAASIS
jgi:transcriptional regulator with XRE-family HTH domain/tetratricopeptide (TPR) repeat protein